MKETLRFPGTYGPWDWTHLLLDDGLYAHTAPAATNAYIELDYGEDREIDAIYIKNRSDCCRQRITGTNVTLYDSQRVARWSVLMTTNRVSWKLPVNPTTNGQTDTVICQQLGGLC